MTLALVMGYLRGSSGQQAAAFIPSERRLTERPHPDSVRNVNSPPRQAGACAHLRQAQLSGRPAGPGGLPRPAGPAIPQSSTFTRGLSLVSCQGAGQVQTQILPSPPRMEGAPHSPRVP